MYKFKSSDVTGMYGDTQDAILNFITTSKFLCIYKGIKRSVCPYVVNFN